MLSSRAGHKLAALVSSNYTMEKPDHTKSDFDYKSLVRQCFEFCTLLKQSDRSFSFELKLDPIFKFSLASESGLDRLPEAKKRHRCPSYRRRQLRRKEAFLQRTAETSSVKKASALSKCKNKDSAGEGRPAIIAQGGQGCAEVGECFHNETEDEKEVARIRQEIGVPPPPPPIEPPRRLITIVRNRNNRPKIFSQLDGTSHQGVDNDDNEEPDGLEEREMDNQEPEETNETDASVGESYDDALWRLAADAYNNPVLFWACQVCPDKPETDKGEEKSAICNICKNNMELFEVADWMPPLPM